MNAKTEAEFTQAIETNKPLRLESLIADGAAVDGPLGRCAWPPLHQAVVSRHAEIVKALLRHGADPNGTIGIGLAAGMVPLDFAKDREIIQSLLEAGAKDDIQDKRGMDARAWAKCMRNTALAWELMKHAAKSLAVA